MSTAPPVWPEQLDAHKAAQFCGERSLPAFRRKVSQGIYPAPTWKVPGSRAMWHRVALERFLAARHGLSFDGVSPEVELA